jgi:putative tricarboxylic transport membrane protein
MKLKKALMILVVFAVALGLLGACGKAPAASSEAAYEVPKDMVFMAGAAAGGGQDTFLRTIIKALNDSNIIKDNIKVEYVTGGGGLSAIQTLLGPMKGRSNILFSGAGGMQALEVGNNTELRQKDATLVARVILETTCMVTAADNPKVDTIEKLIAALKADPKSVTFGGSAAPGEDYLAPVMVFDALGLNSKDLKYVVYDGGGECIPALMGHHIDISFSSTAEWTASIEAGQIKCVAVAADERVGGLFQDIPTFKEKGINFVWQNWRGLLGPIGMDPKAVKFWQDALAKMNDTQAWKDACKKLQYESAIQFDGFKEFAIEYEEQVEKAMKLAGVI